MVHKHDATRLHYDLRLEIDGALASWAVPKGPSFDPAVRRLAVQTEDHPLAYGDFEGRIPDGQYGAGDSLVWDRGSFETVPPGQASAMRKKGHIEFELAGEKLRGRWHLVRTRPQGGKPSWLLFKARDAAADPGFDVTAERPESVLSGRRTTTGPRRRSAPAASRAATAPAATSPVDLLLRVWPPMLATPATSTAVDAKHHLLEVKYDGYRALAGISGGELSLQSRNGLDLSRRFPAIAATLAKLDATPCVLDGEIVAVDAHGVTRFAALKRDPRSLRFVAFDLLWLDRDDLRDRPLEQRRQALERLLAAAPERIQLAERVPGSTGAALARAKRRGLEGLIAKRRGSRYEGRRSSSWLKLKLQATADVAVLGYTRQKNGSPGIGALLVGVIADDGPSRSAAPRFVYAGRVGTGFTDRDRRELETRLAALRITRPPLAVVPRLAGVVWVRPRLVAAVELTEWTADGKLRHPSFQGLREDKRPEECRRERERARETETARPVSRARARP